MSKVLFAAILLLACNFGLAFNCEKGIMNTVGRVPSPGGRTAGGGGRTAGGGRRAAGGGWIRILINNLYLYYF